MKMNLWNNPGIPHKGWTCIGMEDLAEFAKLSEFEYEHCEMCGKEKIRYVHIMKNDDGSILRVGSNCAALMEDDYAASKQRDNELKNRSQRRANFLKQTWSMRSNGNLVLMYKGGLITIIKSKFNSGYGVIYRNNIVWEYKGIKPMNLEIAKIAAFDIFD